MDKTQQMTLPGGNRTRRSRALRGVRGTAAAGALVSLAAVGLLLGGCSKEPLEGPGGGRVELRLQAELPNVVVLPGVSTRAVADPSQDMEMYFLREDESAPGVWGDAEVLPARRPAGQWQQPLVFSPVQYYLSGDLKTRMAGWYPGGGEAPGGGRGYYDAASRTVSWTIDGSQDILLAGAGEGSSSQPIPMLSFAHALTQLQFHCYAATEASAQKWGTVTRIEVRGQRTLCTYDLSAERMSFGGAEQTLTVPGEAPLPLPVGDKAQALLFGEPLMVHPRTEPEQLLIVLHTSGEGPVTAAIPQRAYLPGKSARIVVRFEKEKLQLYASTVEIDELIGATPDLSYIMPYIVAPNIIINKDLLSLGGWDAGRTEPAKWNSASYYPPTQVFPIEPDWMRGHSWNYIQVGKKVVTDGGSATMLWQDITKINADDMSLTGPTPCASYWELSQSEKGQWRVATPLDMAKILVNLHWLDVDWWDGRDNCLIALNYMCERRSWDSDVGAYVTTRSPVYTDITKARKEMDATWVGGPYYVIQREENQLDDKWLFQTELTKTADYRARCVCVRDLDGL